MNNNYFSKIDSNNKAYILGLFYSDGCLSKNCLSFSSTDYELVKFVHNEINLGNVNVYTDLKNTSWKDRFTYSVSDKQLTFDIKSLGICERKSLILTFPTEEQLPRKYLSHFIRGYFDGDGCVWNGKRKKHWVKDNDLKKGYKYRIVHNVKFNIVGNKEFLIELQKYIVIHLNFRFTKIGSKKGVNENYGQLEYSGRTQLFKFYEFIYKDAELFLERKYNKFKEILFSANIQ